MHIKILNVSNVCSNAVTIAEGDVRPASFESKENDRVIKHFSDNVTS